MATCVLCFICAGKVEIRRVSSFGTDCLDCWDGSDITFISGLLFLDSLASKWS